MCGTLNTNTYDANCDSLLSGFATTGSSVLMMRNVIFNKKFSQNSIQSDEYLLDFVVSVYENSSPTKRLIKSSLISAYSLSSVNSYNPLSDFSANFVNFRFNQYTDSKSPTFLRIRGDLQALLT